MPIPPKRSNPTRAAQDVTRVQPKPRDVVEVGPERQHPYRGAWGEFWPGFALEVTNSSFAPVTLMAKTLDKTRAMITGDTSHALEHPIQKVKEENEEALHPQGAFGRAGRLAGLVAGELPYYEAGGKVVEAGLNNAIRSPIAKKLLNAIEEVDKFYGVAQETKVMREGVVRAVGQATAASPAAAALGAASTPEGENVVPRAALSALAWGAAGFVTEPIVEIGARGFAEAAPREFQELTGTASQRLGEQAVQRDIGIPKFIADRSDDYMKYDLTSRLDSSRVKLKKLIGW